MDLRLQTLRQEVKQFRKKSKRITQRFLALIELTKLKQKHGRVRELDYERLALRFEISGRTLYRWEALYRQGGARALVPRKAPGRRPKGIRGHTAKKITRMRKLYNWGAEVIQAHLQHDCGIKHSKYEINRFLRRKGLLIRKKCKRKKPKHTQVVQVDHPGEHTQLDVKHLPWLLPRPKKCYVYNFVDHASKWAFKRAYDSFGPSETKDFISAVVQAAPFAITRLQSDNGVEFTNKYTSHLDSPVEHALDLFCKNHGIRHVLIPPGEKELQGLVERSHRQDDEELFHRITPKTLVEFNMILKSHCEWRNAKRRRKSLGWKTANEFLREYRTKIQNFLWGDGIQSDLKIELKTPSSDEPIESVKEAA